MASEQLSATAVIESLTSFLGSAVTPWHAVQEMAARFSSSGFQELREDQVWKLNPGHGYFVTRGGTALAAFIAGDDPAAGWTISAAHTDSPGWRIKAETQKRPQPGILRVGTEIYGSPIHATWFDRPLAVAGRVFIKGPDGRPVGHLVQSEACAAFPNVAIHYNREANKGLVYDLSEHLSLLIAVSGAATVESWLCQKYRWDPHDWLSADLFAVEPSGLKPWGTNGFFMAPRIDNLTGCHAAQEALLAVSRSRSPQTRALVCFDNEEIGSASWTGADSSWFRGLMERVILAAGGSKEDRFRSASRSFIVSVDSAHGRHPNWSPLHDEAYSPWLGGGPVIKRSAKVSYSTSAATEALVLAAAQTAGIALQTYVMKSTLTPGSTVGPLLGQQTGIQGIDVGIPLLAMHSAVETAHGADQSAMIQLLQALYRG